jgi:hypothetical protein
MIGQKQQQKVTGMAAPATAAMAATATGSPQSSSSLSLLPIILSSSSLYGRDQESYIPRHSCSHDNSVP